VIRTSIQWADRKNLTHTNNFPISRLIQKNFPAILEHLGIAEKANYTDAEKLSIYREHKKLVGAVILTLAGGIYEFSIRTGENEGLHSRGPSYLSVK